MLQPHIQEIISMPETALVVLTTLPDRQTAIHLCETLVTEKLAACVNILPEITSIYRWDGKIQRDTEYQLVIKSHQQCYRALQQRIHQEHPYEVPEILALTVTDGLPEYLEWIEQCTQKS